MSFIADTKASWKESLSYFTKSELKTLTLVTLNNFYSASLVVLRSFWWLFLVAGVSLIGLMAVKFMILSKVEYSNVIAIALQVFFGLSLFTFGCSVYSLYYFWFLAVRASMERKDIEYFKKYISHLFGFFVISFLIGFFCYMQSVLQFFLYFSLLFFLDSDGTVKSIFIAIQNGLKIIWYFLPFFMLFPVLWLLISSVPEAFFIAWIKSLHETVYVYLCGFIKVFELLVSLLVIALCSALYIKIKHSNYRLFFKN